MESTRCREDEELEAYVDRVESTISQDLGISVTPFTCKDKVMTHLLSYYFVSFFFISSSKLQDELIKRKRIEALPQRTVQRPNVRWQAMASQVKEVLPHVPMAVILSDLSMFTIFNYSDTV